jgi:hypothetical protein
MMMMRGALNIINRYTAKGKIVKGNAFHETWSPVS